MVIPWEWAPDGVSYMQCLDTRPGGGKNIRETWISVFETANVGARETSSDEDEYSEWLEGLIKAGKIPACTPDVAQRMLERAIERLEKSKADAAKSGGHGANNLRALLQAKEVEVLQAVVGDHRTTKAAAKATPSDLTWKTKHSFAPTNTRSIKKKKKKFVLTFYSMKTNWIPWKAKTKPWKSPWIQSEKVRTSISPTIVPTTKAP